MPATAALDLISARGDRRDAAYGGDLTRTISGFGLRERLPFGRMRAQGDRGWWCADPVHLAADANGLRLFRPGLDTSDARELAAVLTNGLGREVRTVNATHWVVDFDTHVATTVPTHEVLGHGIEPFMPTGADAVAVRRWMTEAQMLLHDHPVNLRRARRGEAVVNAVWPWGGDDLPGPILPVYRHACAMEPACAGLALDYSEPPNGFARLDDPAGTLVWVETAHRAAASGDPDAWIEAVTEIERSWIAPAWDAVVRGDLDRFRVFDGVSSWTGAHARVRWRFWRRGGFLEACDDVAED